MQSDESRGPQLAVECSEQDGVHLIELTGELDLSSVGELEAALAAVHGAQVCLDLTELEFIDSTGLAAIIRAHQAIGAAGGALTVVAAGGSVVRRTLETSGLMALLSVVDDRATALQALA
jgi:anti-anti-sigma factor